MNTRQFAVVAATTAAAALATAGLPLAQTGSASALPVTPAAAPAQIVNIESDVQLDDVTTAGGDVVFARTSPAQAGAGFGWRLRIDVRIKNTGLVPVTVTSITVDTDETAPQNFGLDAPVVINAGKERTVVVPDSIGEADADGPSTLTVHGSGLKAPELSAGSSLPVPNS